MSTLKATVLKNAASTTDNLTLNPDGSISFAVAPTGVSTSLANMTGINAGAQTALANPVNAANGVATLDATGKLPAADLPIATTTAIGAIKATANPGGQFVTGVDATGALTYGAAAGSYTLPIAVAATIGGVKANAGTAGQFVNGVDATGALTYAIPAGTYTLPAPTTTTLGGVKSNAGTTGQFVNGVAADGSLSYGTVTGGLTYIGSKDVTAAYTAPSPVPPVGSYLTVSTTGTLHATWAAEIANAPTTVTAGDTVLFDGTKWHVAISSIAPLAAATASALGGVKANTGTAGQYVSGVAADGSLTYGTPAGTYTLAAATAAALGGVKATANPGSQFVTGIDANGDLTFAAAAGTYTLPIATTTVIGGVMRNAGTSGQFVNGIDATGALTYATPTAYTLPAATTTALGGIIATANPGSSYVSGVAADGSLQWTSLPAASTYTLPVATAAAIGGVKANAGTAGQYVAGVQADGTLTYGTPAGSYTLPAPTATVLGGVMANAGTAGQYVSGINASGQLVYGTPAGTVYTLPAATTAALGGLKLPATAPAAGECFIGTAADGTLTVGSYVTTDASLLTSGTLANGRLPNVITARTYAGVKEVQTAPAIGGGAVTLDCDSANVFAVNLNANLTSIAFTNVPVAGTAYAMTLALTISGAFTVTWPTSVKWAKGTAPTLTTTTGKVDMFTLVTWDGGTSWYGVVAGQEM